MDHQPFENWLLSEEPISPENANVLQDHLDTCKHCQELHIAWSGVMEMFQEVPDIGPEPGFIIRWQNRLETERQVEMAVRHRWQSIIMLILIGNVIVSLVVLLGTQFLTTFESPVALLLSGVYRLASMVTWINVIQNIVVTMFRTLTSVVPAGLWAVLGIGLVGAGATWIISLTSLSALPRRD
jgi:predicted anti-sigma-YlaC factor YlaD